MFGFPFNFQWTYFDNLDAGLDDSLPLKSHSEEDKSSTSSEDTRELTPTPRDLPADDESVKTEISKQEEEVTSKQKVSLTLIFLTCWVNHEAW